MARSIARRVGLLVPCALLMACFSSSSSSTSSSSTSSGDGGGGGGGCGGGSWTSAGNGGVRDAPDRDGAGVPPIGPEGAAPTGQSWQPVETDEGCGRSGLAWVLVDEICRDGSHAADPRALEAPMFRDGALVGGDLFAIDATHLWSIDMSAGGGAPPARKALLSGIGQPLAIASRGTDLVVAAGRAGLLLVDAANPRSPTRASSLLLPGHAYDVALDGASTALVAMGEEGVAVTSLAGPPSLVKTYAVPGLAVGVTADASHAYVAACSTFAIVDRATGAVTSQVWVPDPLLPKRLAPAKDVALVGDVAFVAAGKLGAVAIDVSDKSQPKVLGSCRIEDPKFYASGVRVQGSTVYVAGGEWGVLKVDASDPKGACTTSATVPPPPAPATGDVECSTRAPWEIVDWPMLWEPPPPGKDPVQVLPDGDRVFAFGDARRIGVRAVDVRSASTLALTARYDEPRALVAMASSGSRVMAAGPHGGTFTLDGDGALVRAEAAGDDVLRKASLLAALGDGRWVAGVGSDVHVEGRAAPITLDEAPWSLSAHGQDDVVVAMKTRGVHVVSTTNGLTKTLALPRPMHLPLALASRGTRVFAAGPEWSETATIDLVGAGASLVAHAVFDEDDALDVAYWRERLPRRHLSPTASGLVELAAIGPRAGVVLHRATGADVKVAVPPMTYAGLTTAGGRAYAIGLDRGRYKSYLVTVELEGGNPRVVSLETFTGAASAIAHVSGRIVVADADGAFRVYTPGDAGPTLTSVTRVEVP